MAMIQTQRRYWAYEPVTLDLQEAMEGTPDETAHRVGPFLSEVSTEYVEEGGIEIHFVSPEGERYVAHAYAVVPEIEEEEEEEEDLEDQGYAWMVEIYPDKGEEDVELVDYEAIFHWPKDQERIRFQDVVPSLAAIAEAVYALSDIDEGSPTSPMENLEF